jgi:hypothetical protein
VPDFVGGVLDSVNEFLGGGVDDLGETVSEVAGNGAGDGEDDGSDASGGEEA